MTTFLCWFPNIARCRQRQNSLPLPFTTVSKSLQPYNGNFRMECPHNPTCQSLTCTCLCRFLSLVIDAQLGSDLRGTLLLILWSHYLSRMYLFSLTSSFSLFTEFLAYKHAITNLIFNKAFLGPLMSLRQGFPVPL